MLHPTGSAADYTGHLHDKNIVIRADYGEISIMLTGDAEANVEQELVELGLNLQSHILKMGHHGSRTSSTLPFVEAVAPEIAIYQAGQDNRYGHPHEEALANVAAVDATIYGNDVHGTIIVETDGPEVTLTTTREAPTVTPGEAVSPTEPPAAALGACVDVNLATTEQLQEIIHIGEERAEQIVELRQQRDFESLDELTRVDGIAAGRLQDIEEEGVACVP